VWPLPASDLLYVGRATTRKLYKYGIETIGQLANTEPELLRDWFGKVGLILHYFANGRDESPVMQVGDETIIKSIGNSTTTPRDLENELDAKIVFYMLAESVAERLRDHGLLAKTVQISVRDNGLFWFQRQMKVDEPTCLASELCDTAMELLRANYRWQTPLRSIGIRGCDLMPASTPKQLKLFEDEAEREKLEQLERTVDDISRRFGHYSIYRAVVEFDQTLKHINPKEDHTIHPIGYFKAT
jgi:DNA polymerase-4